MAETNMNAFTNSCAGYVHTHILGPIVAHLTTTRGYQVTIEELAGVLQMPTTRAAATPIMPAPAVPAMAFGGAVPPMATAVAPTTARKNTATATPVVGRTCMYQFKRGENKGKFCGKATAPGSEHCNSCLKTRKNLQQTIAAHGAVPGAAPGMGAIPGMAGLPPGYTGPSPVVPATATASAQGGQLSVIPYDEVRGLFKEPNHGFIVYQVGPGVIAVIGKLNEAENKIGPLSEQEKITAQTIGLVIADAQGTTTTTTQTAFPVPQFAPAVPQVPAVPTVPQVPQVPAGTPTAVIQPPLVPFTTAGTGQPALPFITPLAAPAMPAQGGVPQIPGIPQINM